MMTCRSLVVRYFLLFALNLFISHPAYSAPSDVVIIDTNGNNVLDWNEGIQLSDGTNISSEQMQLIRLYSGSFRRLPDVGGFDYWIGRFFDGTSFTRMGDEFYWSPEMQAVMDTNGDGTVTHNEFITHLYRFVLDREPDEAGYNFWIGRLEAGTGYGTALAEFLNGQEFIDAKIDEAILFAATYDYEAGLLNAGNSNSSDSERPAFEGFVLAVSGDTDQMSAAWMPAVDNVTNSELMVIKWS